MKLETVIYEKKEGFIIISLNRPKVLNAINLELLIDLLEALRAAEVDTEAKPVVILKGEGRAFSAGADISGEPPSERVPMELRHYIYPDYASEICRVMVRMPKIIIAAVHGYAIGGGLELAECADIRIVAEGTKFRAPETSLGGSVTNAGTKLLTYYIGLGRAREFYYTNEFMDANEAFQYGLANKVVPLDELDKAVMDMAKKISGMNALALALNKTAVNRALGMSIEETVVMETRDAYILRAAKRSVSD